ncbi:Oidioi.mRNA.OKI2018_I69.XSR.g16178.t2.cds [Oikopleura dioica]|uniref:Protein tweety homolog n=1 Tax=Oikopleura dioica TaxID=34765 RepID=A0ABN7SKD5_OIKDI|nr:Oidioi.mRNA.OKI2018_I69.XSR.g16178.t2.cds [Oikopleura dioica]
MNYLRLESGILPEMETSTMTTWLPTEWAQLGNRFPHFTFKFQILQNPSFEPFLPAYKESLLFYAVFPLSLMLLLLLVYLLYYCCRDWTKTVVSSNKCNPSLFVSNVILVLITTCILVGAYSCFGAMRNDYRNIVNSSRELKKLVDEVNAEHMFKEQTKAITKVLLNAEKGLSGEFQERLYNFRVAYPYVEWLPLRIGNSTMNEEYEPVMERAQEIENYRLIASGIVFGYLLLLVVICVASTCVKNSTLFVGSIILGFLGLLILHFSLGIQLTASVALSDLCMNPAYFVEKTLLDEGWLNRNEIDVVLRCDQDSEKVQRFEQLLRELEKRDRELEEITQGINLKYTKPAKKVLQAQQLHNKLKNNVEGVHDLLSCKRTHKEYKNIIDLSCGNYLMYWWIMTGITTVCLILVGALLFVLPEVMSTVSVNHHESLRDEIKAQYSKENTLSSLKTGVSGSRQSSLRHQRRLARPHSLVTLSFSSAEADLSVTPNEGKFGTPNLGEVKSVSSPKSDSSYESGFCELDPVESSYTTDWSSDH